VSTWLISYREVKKIVNFSFYANCRNGCPLIDEIQIGCSGVRNVDTSPSGVRDIHLALVMWKILQSEKMLVSSMSLVSWKTPDSGNVLFSQKSLISGGLACQFDNRTPNP